MSLLRIAHGGAAFLRGERMLDSMLKGPADQRIDMLYNARLDKDKEDGRSEVDSTGLHRPPRDLIS